MKADGFFQMGSILRIESLAGLPMDRLIDPHCGLQGDILRYPYE
jgi:hypothetical protein